MGRLFKVELKRSLFNKRTFVAFICAMVFCVIHFTREYNIWLETMTMHDKLGFSAMKSVSTATPYSKWILFDSNVYSYILLFIMPILVVMPYGMSYYSDLKSGYIKQIISRTAVKTYMRAKYLVTFISGGIVIVLPLFIEFIAMATIYPLHKPIRYSGPMNGETTFCIDLFYEHPMVYTFMRLLLLYVVAGLLATVSLIVSRYISGYFNSFITPFVVSFLFLFISYITTKNEFAFINSLQGRSQMDFDYRYLFGQIIIMFLCTYLGFVRSKKEVY